LIERLDPVRDDRFPNHRFPSELGALVDFTHAGLGWLIRAANAVGAPRFQELVDRAGFYLDKAFVVAQTPAERAVVDSLIQSGLALLEADGDARRVLAESVSGMSAADATEFVELIEENNVD
jgi:hypothetical protein